MGNTFLKLFSFLKTSYSEPNGNGSSSRILSTILALVVSKILLLIFSHIISITDIAILGLWLANLPLIIAALVFFFTAPYGVNKGSSSITDILNIFKGKKNE